VWSAGATAYVDSDAGRNDAKTTTFDYDRLGRERRCAPSRATTHCGRRRGRITRRATSPPRPPPTGCSRSATSTASAKRRKPRGKRASDAAGSWSLKDQQYGYDANGNRARDERGTHEFNARDQLVKWTRGGRNGAVGTTVSYELNASGAIAKRTDSALPSGKRTLTNTYNGTRLSKAEDAESESTYSG
jgi:hypothetical protein